ncbi:glycosyltransferase [Thermococcus sp.]|uniref:glycosyltransferase n=1 Tax=Thermococcus sp. TaxID=35749 RepID=UPI00263363D9|nr:glycosyltransferase [Thermococcus sp.]
MAMVSVIIPTLLGREHLLKRAILSVLNQTFQDFEIIIVKNYKETKLDLEDPRINEVYEARKGVSTARNTGMKISGGKYIAFLDDDDVWLPNKLEEQLKIFKKSPDVGLVYGKYKHMGNGKIIPPKIIEGNVFENLLRDNFIGTSTVIIRKEVFESIGGFDESLYIGEDWDYWLRISEQYIVRGVNSIVSIYSGPTLSSDYKKVFYGLTKFMNKWFPKMNKNAQIKNTLRLLWYSQIYYHYGDIGFTNYAQSHICIRLGTSL